MKSNHLLLLLLLAVLSSCACNKNRKTKVSIKGNQFYINDTLTYKDRVWNGNKIEGLLFNSRMVQGIFDDLNPETRNNFKYPDTQEWDPNRNTQEFIDNMPIWKAHGVLAFTLNLQGGSPLGYGNKGWKNPFFDTNGNIIPAYAERLERILNEADDLGMIVILGYFYFGQDDLLKDENAVLDATDNITDWILHKGYTNLLIEVNNECNVRYDHAILKPKRIHELIQRVQNKSDRKLLVSTSYGGNFIPKSNVVKNSDFILIHGNGVKKPARIKQMVELTKQVEGYTPKPILFNEDDHFKFDKEEYNMLSAIEAYASWGYFDYRKSSEAMHIGFQTVPVDWSINSPRKQQFFNKVKEITNY